jgi:ubiquinone biosynthesis protein
MAEKTFQEYRLPPEYALLARAGSLLDGLARELFPDLDIMVEVRPFAERLLARRLAPERVAGDALRLFQHAQVAIRDVPLRFSQLLDDLGRGAIQVRAVDPDAEAMRVEVRHAGVRVAVALCSTALAVSGALLLSTWTGTLLGLPVAILGGLACFGTGVMLFVALVLHTLVPARLGLRDVGRAALATVRFLFGRKK